MEPQQTLVVALAGPIASGKTTIATLLASNYGFIHLRSKTTLIRLLEERGEPVNEITLQAIGKEIVDKIGGRGLTELVLQGHDPSKNYVYDSIRNVDDCQYLRERFGKHFRLIYLDGPEEIRKQRYFTRVERETSEESFYRRISHPVEAETPALSSEADAVILNKELEVTLSDIDSLFHSWMSLS
jgi:dephospho-CoA kinase